MFLRLFGPPTLLASNESGASVLLPPGKPAAILAFLACVPSRRVSRDELADLLWSHVEPERARQSLRQALTQLRRALGTSAIETAESVVGLQITVQSDVAQFDAALADGQAADALRFVGAPFLSDFATPGGATFERWAAAVRMRYDSAVARARELVAREHLDAGRFREAREIARLALRDAPDREPAWRLLLEVLLAADDRLGAALEVAALEHWLSDEEREPEPATRRLVKRVRAEWSDAPAGAALNPATGTPVLPSPELVGREREFARVLGAWADARSRGLVRVHVTGAPGIGKSRLVNEVRLRLCAAGVNTPVVRCHPGSRRIPALLLADVMTALAHLPGAIGVSPACAASLVELVPTLADTYRGATTGPGDTRQPGPAAALGADVERRWLQALEQLLTAVSDERPLALVLDDVHWADDVSSRVILGSLERLGSCRLLLLTTAREGTAASWTPADETHAVALAPLDAEDVDALVRSIGTLPTAPWPETLLPALASSARGVPLVILELLALLTERALLALTGEGWQLSACAHALDAACALLATHAGPGARVSGLELDAQRTLAALAVVGAPLDTPTVATGAGCDASSAETRLGALAQRGLARLTEAGLWEPAHDEIRAATLSLVAHDVLRPTARALGACYLAHAATAGDATLPLIRAATAFVAGGASEQLERVFARWVAHHRRHGDRRSDVVLARELLGDAATDERVRDLVATRPLLERIGWRARRTTVAALAAGLVIATGVGAGQAVAARAADVRAHQTRRPARLALVTTPLAWKAGFPMTPVPIIEVQDAVGDPVTTASDSVRVDVSGAMAIVAANAAPVVRGRATFDRVVLAQAGPGSLSVRFTYPGVPPLTVPLVGANGAEFTIVRLTLVGANVNGQSLSPSQRVARVGVGDSIALSLDLRYTSPWPAANVVMGAAPSWGDPAKTFVRLASLVTPARDFTVHTETRLQAPNAPGRYFVVVAFGAEENVTYLLSGTNWTVGRAIWHDGNDVAAWSDAQREEADRTGSASAVMLERRGGAIASGVAVPVDAAHTMRHPIRVPATTLTIDVLGR